MAAEGTSRGTPPRGTGVFPVLALAVVLVQLGVLLEAIDTDAVVREEYTNVLVVLGIYVAALGLLLRLAQAGPPRPRAGRARQPVCTHCLHPYVVGVHFCRRCSAPTTVLSATASYESVYAQAWCIGKAAHSPTRILHPLGITLIAAPSLLVVLLFLFAGGQEVPWEWYEAAGFASHLVFAYVCFLLLRRTWSRWLRARREPADAVPGTDYDHVPWWTYDRDAVYEERDETHPA